MMGAVPQSLTERKPNPSAAHLVSELVPPPLFSNVSLESYQPDPQYPSQAQAVARIREFARSLQPAGKKAGFLSGLFGGKKTAPVGGLYLDGGFGVGKTHLLTSLFSLSPGRAVYGTFVEYTNLVGVLGYQKAVEEFADVTLMCIDEFELDDVGDTLLMTRLIRELSDKGVAIAATSNTLPRALGEGRFAAQDFLREIKAMAERFEVVRIDGEDYRHRENTPEGTRHSNDEVVAAAERAEKDGRSVTLDAFSAIRDHLTQVHPSRYGAMVQGLDGVFLTEVTTVDDHREALRLVVLVDRLYDRSIPVIYAGVPVSELFTQELLDSGYAKKYLRCLSRMGALSREAV